MGAPPEPDRVRRLGEALAALAPELAGGGPLALAVSGGPDSMALLVLAAAARPGGVIAATVDHRLRPASAGEAAAVAAGCASLGVPHAILPVDHAPGATGNLHDWARRERYRLLGGWAAEAGAAALATAHHADDQAETFLMRAGRGCGLSGLAGVRARIGAGEMGGEGPSVVRPLLGWRRAELRAVAEASRLPFADDPSNADPRFERARIRRWLADPCAPDPPGLAAAAAHAAEAEESLAAAARLLWEARARPAAVGEVRIDMAGLPRGLRRALVGIAIREVAASAGPLRSMERLLDALEAGGGATLGPVQGSARGTLWHFRPAPPRRTG